VDTHQRAAGVDTHPTAAGAGWRAAGVDTHPTAAGAGQEGGRRGHPPDGGRGRAASPAGFPMVGRSVDTNFVDTH
jgi:hypothetical protein